jgi:hypothetical protein
MHIIFNINNIIYIIMLFKKKGKKQLIIINKSKFKYFIITRVVYILKKNTKSSYIITRKPTRVIF